MNGDENVCFFGNTANGVYSGHLYIEGKPVAGVCMTLPDDLWPEKKHGRGVDVVRFSRDIETLAAFDVVGEQIRRDECEATAAQKQALVMSMLGEGKRYEFEELVEQERDNERQFNRRLKNARDALSGFKVEVRLLAGATWSWMAFAENGRAVFYGCQEGNILQQGDGSRLLLCAPEAKDGRILFKPIANQGEAWRAWADASVSKEKLDAWLNPVLRAGAARFTLLVPNGHK